MPTELLFWCVWNEGGGSPTYKHAEYSTASKEAQRLARANPGKRFVVLAAAVAYVVDDLRETRFSSDPRDHHSACECDDCVLPF